MDDTPKYFGVHTPPQAVDPVAYDAATTRVLKHGNRIRYLAQSILTGIISRPDVPTIDQARDILAWANRTPTK